MGAPAVGSIAGVDAVNASARGELTQQRGSVAFHSAPRLVRQLGVGMPGGDRHLVTQRQ